MGITINNNHALTVKGTAKVSIETGVLIAGTGTNLPVTITADFSGVPEELHEIYFQAFSYQYRGQAVVYNNTGSVKPCQREKSNIGKIVELALNPKNWIFKKKNN